MTKAISLSAELAEVRCAIEGARFIADGLSTHSLDSREHELQAPVSITAILVLAELRLRQVERVLRGEEARRTDGPRTTTSLREVTQETGRTWCSGCGTRPKRTQRPQPGRTV